MRLDKLAVTAQEAFQSAMGVAGDAETASVDTIHLLKALLDSGRTTSPPLSSVSALTLPP